MLKPLQRQGKGRALNSFQRLSNLSFLPCNMRKRQRAPFNGRASIGSWQGWGKFWPSTGFRIPSLPLELMNNKLNNKKNELWKMKLFK
nr:MAG TPA: hypothetical protein [Caudoviricetes sp.]